MMHPTVVAALATERHADLLRAAEAYRRTARPVGSAPLPGLQIGLRTRSGSRVTGLARAVRGLADRRPSSATAPCCA